MSNLDETQREAVVAASMLMYELLVAAWDAARCDPNPRALTAVMDEIEEFIHLIDKVKE